MKPTQTQCIRLLEHLKIYRTIDPLESWEKLGIYRLSARIFDLIKDQNRINKRMKTVINRFGEECKVAEYTLEYENEQTEDADNATFNDAQADDPHFFG